MEIINARFSKCVSVVPLVSARLRGKRRLDRDWNVIWSYDNSETLSFHSYGLSFYIFAYFGFLLWFYIFVMCFVVSTDILLRLNELFFILF